jgi:hypothetical protein
MNAHVGLTIESGQAKFSVLQHFIFSLKEAAWSAKVPG